MNKAIRIWRGVGVVKVNSSPGGIYHENKPKE
jgi:hypothetical protein